MKDSFGSRKEIRRPKPVAWFPLSPFEGLRRSHAAVPASPPGKLPLMGFVALQSVVCDGGASHWVPLAPASAFAVSGPPSRSSIHRRPPRLSPRVHPLMRFRSLQSMTCHRRPGRAGHLPWASAPSSRRQPEESTFAGIPSPLRSALDVSHVLDGLLLFRPCGFVSPRCRVQGSLFRGFLSREAVRARHPPLPSCRLRAIPASSFPMAPGSRGRLQGFAPLANPLRTKVG